jgi:hypothetical protein
LVRLFFLRWGEGLSAGAGPSPSGVVRMNIDPECCQPWYCAAASVGDNESSDATRIKTFSRLAKQIGERAYSSNAVRMTFDFIVVYSLLRWIILLVMGMVISKVNQKAGILIRRFQPLSSCKSCFPLPNCPASMLNLCNSSR